MQYRGNNQHNRNINEVEQYTAKRHPEKSQVAPTNTLTEENTVMVVIFDADVAVFAMVCVMLNLNMAYTAP